MSPNAHPGTVSDTVAVVISIDVRKIWRWRGRGDRLSGDGRSSATGFRSVIGTVAAASSLRTAALCYPTPTLSDS